MPDIDIRLLQIGCGIDPDAPAKGKGRQMFDDSKLIHIRDLCREVASLRDQVEAKDRRIGKLLAANARYEAALQRRERNRG